MKVKLKFPIFTFGNKGDDMVYVFFDEKQLKSTNLEYLNRNLYNNTTIIDSTGNIYTIKKAYKVKYRGFFGFNPMLQGRQILVDFEYTDDSSQISLEELKEMILSSYPKSHWFHSTWPDVKDFKEEMDKCTSFEEVAKLLG